MREQKKTNVQKQAGIRQILLLFMTVIVQNESLFHFGPAVKHLRELAAVLLWKSGVTQVENVSINVNKCKYIYFPLRRTHLHC